jgi:DnaJ-class molecular chaperone
MLAMASTPASISYSISEIETRDYCKPAILANGSIKRRRETHVKTCPDCNGEGVIEKGTDDEQRCPRCGGSGFVPDEDDDEEVTRTAS